MITECENANLMGHNSLLIPTNLLVKSIYDFLGNGQGDYGFLPKVLLLCSRIFRFLYTGTG